MILSLNFTSDFLSISYIYNMLLLLLLLLLSSSSQIINIYTIVFMFFQFFFYYFAFICNNIRKHFDRLAFLSLN